MFLKLSLLFPFDIVENQEIIDIMNNILAYIHLQKYFKESSLFLNINRSFLNIFLLFFLEEHGNVSIKH